MLSVMIWRLITIRSFWLIYRFVRWTIHSKRFTRLTDWVTRWSTYIEPSLRYRPKSAPHHLFQSPVPRVKSWTGAQLSPPAVHFSLFCNCPILTIRSTLARFFHVLHHSLRHIKKRFFTLVFTSYINFFTGSVDKKKEKKGTSGKEKGRRK